MAAMQRNGRNVFSHMSIIVSPVYTQLDVNQSERQILFMMLRRKAQYVLLLIFLKLCVGGRFLTCLSLSVSVVLSVLILSLSHLSFCFLFHQSPFITHQQSLIAC